MRIVFLVLLLMGSANLAHGDNIVTVEGGAIQGVVQDDVVAFRGIPFAAPPIGALRWRPPQPVIPWDGVRAAAQFSANPMQPVDKAPIGAAVSEDCLYLNVVRPTAATQGEAKPLPVFVWIYGGGLAQGGASLYPGHALAKQGVLVVTFNYRLGRLGFFAHPALSDAFPNDLRGNFGYMDQLAALSWIKRNIAAFGGDPNNVTIAGESAGGGSVLIHLTSPLSRGLFQRAIVQSAGIPSGRAAATPLRSLAEAESIAVEYAVAQGISSTTKEAVTALQGLSAEVLSEDIDEYVLSIIRGPQIPGLAHAILDGRLVVEDPETAFRNQRQAKVPVLVGANDYDLAGSAGYTKDALFSMFGTRATAARAIYDPSGTANIETLVQQITADQAMVEPSRYIAEAVTNGGQPAFFYRFSYVAEVQRGSMPGAYHATEIAYVFNAIDRFLGEYVRPADMQMASVVSAYWIEFAKRGDPNGGARPLWPMYDPKLRQVLDFGNTGIRYAVDPIAARLDLWRSVWMD